MGAGGTDGNQAGDIWSVIAGHAPNDPVPAWGSSTSAGHYGLGAGFIQEHQGGWVEGFDFGTPLLAGDRILFGGDQGLFLSVRRRRENVRLMDARLMDA